MKFNASKKGGRYSLHKQKLHKHKRAMLTALLLVGVLVSPAGAVSFSCEDFDLEIPEGGKTYYYSRQGTNMTSTMLENAQKQDMLLLIGSYNDGGSLLYTFRAEEREGTAEDVAGQLQTELSNSYSLYMPVEEKLNGRTGWTLEGQSLQNENYQVKIYVAGESKSLILTMMYQSMAEDELQKLLSGLEWSDLSMELEPGAIPLPGGTTGVEYDDPVGEGLLDLLAPQPLEPLPSEAGKEGILGGILSFLKAHIRYALAGLGAVLLAAVLLMLHRFFRKPLRREKGRSYAPRHARK